MNLSLKSFLKVNFNGQSIYLGRLFGPRIRVQELESRNCGTGFRVFNN